MSTAADDQFYREYILDHFKNPRNYGRLESPDISHEEDNPLCGDVVGMDFRVKDGVIEDIRFHGRGCAIERAREISPGRLPGRACACRSTLTGMHQCRSSALRATIAGMNGPFLLC